jgi:cytochrome c biogenesis protein
MTTANSTISAASERERSKVRESMLSRFLRFVSSVRFGVTLLALLALLCMMGMLVMQQNVSGLERYFAELTPAQREIYGRLGLFNVYHAWYFNALLALVSMNIILASIDRFPKAFRHFSKPSVTVPLRWLRDQPVSSEITSRRPVIEMIEVSREAMKATGWRKVRVAEKKGMTYVFGESGTWNRLGAYVVHIGLLTIFAGGFLTAQLSISGSMPVGPGGNSDLMLETVAQLDRTTELTKKLPFEIECVDIQQRLIRKDGPITAANTIDWVTRFNIKDEYGTHEAVVRMNQPFDHRGYRFFQASFTPVGRARSITLQLIPADASADSEINIPRGGTHTLADGTAVEFAQFRGDFRIGIDDTNADTSTYPNPAAVLQITPPGEAPQTAYAVGAQLAGIPVAENPVAGYKYRLLDFERVADQHVLAIQRDPGAPVVYVGFLILCTALIGVFAFSHQRTWAVIERDDEVTKITIGGNANRNRASYEARFGTFEALMEENKK